MIQIDDKNTSDTNQRDKEMNDGILVCLLDTIDGTSLVVCGYDSGLKLFTMNNIELINDEWHVADLDDYAATTG